MNILNYDEKRDLLIKIVTARGIVEDIRHDLDFVGQAILYTYSIRLSCIPDSLLNASEDIIAHIYEELSEPIWVQKIR